MRNVKKYENLKESVWRDTDLNSEEFMKYLDECEDFLKSGLVELSVEDIFQARRIIARMDKKLEIVLKYPASTRK